MTTARTPHELDGFVTPVDGGYEVAAMGQVLGVVETDELAQLMLSEHCATRPRWYIAENGERTLLGVP